MLEVPDHFRALNVPHIEEYFGLWAVMGDRFRAMVDRVNKVDLAAHVAQQQEATKAAGGEGRDYPMIGSVAVIELRGPLTKYGSSLSSGSSTAIARRKIRLAANDDQVSGIVLRIDSPGGTVSGIDDLYNDVCRAAASKPCVGFAEDLCASAAFWSAAGCSKIYGNNRGAMLGSIGTYATVIDYSGAAALAGLKVHVLRSGPYKGATEPGVEVTAEALDDMQRIVDGVTERFIRAVATGRKMTLARTRELADGRIHFASEALEMGLIDDIRSFDDVVESLNKPKSKQGARAMSEPTTETVTQPAAPRAATFQELKAELIGADAGFLVAQLEANASVDQARKSWMTELNARNQASSKAADDAKKAAEAAANRPGVEALGNASDKPGGADPIAAFEALIEAELVAMGPRRNAEPKNNTSFGPRAKATLRAADKHPDAYQAYLLAYNDQHRKQFGSRPAKPLGEKAAIGA